MKGNVPRICAGDRRWMIGWLVLLNLLHTAAVAMLALMVHQSVRGGDGAPERWKSAWVLVGLGAVLYVLRVADSATAEALAQHYIVRLRAKLLRHEFAAPADAGRTARLGSSLMRLVGDLGAVRNWISLGFARMISSSVSVVGILAVTSVVRPVVGAALAISTALVIVAAWRSSLGVGSLIRQLRSHRGRFSNRVAEALLHAPAMRHLGTAGPELRFLLRAGKRIAESQVRRTLAAGRVRRLPELLGGVAYAVVVLAATASPDDLGRRAASAGVLLMLSGMLVGQVRDLAGAWTYRLSFVEARRRIAGGLRRSVLAEPAAPTQIECAGPASVSFRKVWFAPALTGVSIAAGAGDRVWILGPSGSGKSLLLRLAARLTDTVGGEVRIGGVNVRQLGSKELSGSVRLVSPEIPLFRGSLRANVVQGAENHDPVELHRIVELCGLLAPDSQLENGLDSAIADAGSNLPSGLRARVALARALVCRPRVLLIDDPVFLLDRGARTVLDRVLAQVDATVLVVGSTAVAPIEATQVWSVGEGRVTVTVGTSAGVAFPVEGDVSHAELPNLDAVHRLQ